MIALSLAAIAATAPLPAVAAPIGSVTEVVNLATRQLPGAPKLEIRLADSLFPNEVLETAADARLMVDFVDGSILMLGPSSQAVLDSNLIDLAATGHKPTLDLNVGSFLFNSEYRGAERMRLRSPATIIDLRGTSLSISVGEMGETEVAVIEGAVFMQPVGRGRGALVEAGSAGRVDSPDSDVVVMAIPGTVPAAGEAKVEPATPEAAADVEHSSPDTPDSPGNEPSDTNGGGSTSPDPDPPGQSNGTANNSGHDDGSNPGNGDDKGRNNGGAGNPGK